MQKTETTPLQLSENATLPELITLVNTLLQSRTKTRDRGPESTRDMTEEDAQRVMLGDLRTTSHKEAAKILGLSYGQVYSARFGHTFKGVYQEARKTKDYPYVTKK